MRRALAITLTVVFGWMLVAPLLPALMPAAFEAAGDGNLPACCRRNGRHHCMTSGAERGASTSGRSVGQVAEKCPWVPHSTVAARPFASDAAPVARTAVALVGHLAALSQVEANYRIAASRSHQKRGPPGILL